ncbi:helix-turn-helix domain-containing protein [Oceanobacillus jeddahense]|uniref:Helix-turn-helix domain-containing protein n=1 Tax=Oceanobacillus jeddahense TaxID=1462527 RepID=A0ABY5JX38_9BACI|nr:helix-turn-helix transcriptional regulator [Oceanobacillus jeddahense]UUI04955.1 helix-turn-helix domain-containing protein [Oceanobacillus jeddahense]
MTFGEKLRKSRKESTISQEELAFQLQVSRQAISKWENDKGYPET